MIIYDYSISLYDYVWLHTIIWSYDYMIILEIMCQPYAKHNNSSIKIHSNEELKMIYKAPCLGSILCNLRWFMSMMNFSLYSWVIALMRVGNHQAFDDVLASCDNHLVWEGKGRREERNGRRIRMDERWEDMRNLQ